MLEHGPDGVDPLEAAAAKVGDVEERSTLPFDQVWDVVICFDVFYHLLSPLKAALHLTELAKECLVIGSAILPEGIAQSPNFAIELHHATGPVFRFEPGYNGDHSNYLFPTERCLVRVFEWAGFGRIEKKYYYEESKNGYMCDRVCLHYFVRTLHRRRSQLRGGRDGQPNGDSRQAGSLHSHCLWDRPASHSLRSGNPGQSATRLTALPQVSDSVVELRTTLLSIARLVSDVVTGSYSGLESAWRK